MGQYHYVVNLDKREFLDPHQMASGLKLWEQLASHPAIGAGLVVLLASYSNGEGGGDLDEGPAIIGHWRGDRIAFVGDYDNDSRYSVMGRGETMSGAAIYDECSEGKFRNVSKEVCAVIEAELGGKYKRKTSKWVTRHEDGTETESEHEMCHGFVYDNGDQGERGLRPMVIGLAR